MWNWVTYALFIVLGWYIYPFSEGSRIRNAINAMIGNLIRALVAMLQQHEQRKTSSPKKNGSKKAQTVAQPTKQAIPQPNLQRCDNCEKGYIVPLHIDGYEGKGLCNKCSTVQPIR